MPVTDCGWDQKPHCGSAETRHSISGPGPAAGPGRAGRLGASSGGDAGRGGPSSGAAGAAGRGPGQEPAGSGEGAADGRAGGGASAPQRVNGGGAAGAGGSCRRRGMTGTATSGRDWPAAPVTALARSGAGGAAAVPSGGSSGPLRPCSAGPCPAGCPGERRHYPRALRAASGRGLAGQWRLCPGGGGAACPAGPGQPRYRRGRGLPVPLAARSGRARPEPRPPERDLLSLNHTGGSGLLPPLWLLGPGEAPAPGLPACADLPLASLGAELRTHPEGTAGPSRRLRRSAGADSKGWPVARGDRMLLSASWVFSFQFLKCEVEE